MLTFVPIVTEQILEFLRFDVTVDDELSGRCSVGGEVKWDADLLSFWKTGDYEGRLRWRFMIELI